MSAERVGDPGQDLADPAGANTQRTERPTVAGGSCTGAAVAA
jgi:hypothetical protein